MSRKGVDCSGLMVLAFQSANKKIARVSGDQAKGGKPVARSELRRGDLLFFSSKQAGVIGHTALVVEVKGSSVKFIHAANSGVRYDYLESAHWSKLYLCARRYEE
jgi:cell wall-associated NlpC family hydrolase